MPFVGRVLLEHGEVQHSVTRYRGWARFSSDVYPIGLIHGTDFPYAIWSMAPNRAEVEEGVLDFRSSRGDDKYRRASPKEVE